MNRKHATMLMGKDGKEEEGLLSHCLCPLPLGPIWGDWCHLSGDRANQSTLGMECRWRVALGMAQLLPASRETGRYRLSAGKLLCSPWEERIPESALFYHFLLFKQN